MSNHYHRVFEVDLRRAWSWSDEEVARRRRAPSLGKTSEGAHLKLAALPASSSRPRASTARQVAHDWRHVRSPRMSSTFEQLRRRLLPDVWAGLTAGAVLLPQAMAFGAALFAQLGMPASTGALGGLIGAACLCLASGLIGRTHGLMSAPTGPALVLLGSALASASAGGVTIEQLPAALAAMTLMAGAMQFALGASGGGRLIKFIPYPVVAGFMTGAGVLMILSQVDPAIGAGAAEEWRRFGWIPLTTAVVTFAV